MDPVLSVELPEPPVLGVSQYDPLKVESAEEYVRQEMAACKLLLAQHEKTLQKYAAEVDERFNRVDRAEWQTTPTKSNSDHMNWAVWVWFRPGSLDEACREAANHFGFSGNSIEKTVKSIFAALGLGNQRPKGRPRK